MILLSSVLLALQASPPPDSVLGVVRATLRPYADTAEARAAGFVPLALGRFRDGTPFQGMHWIHVRRFREGGVGLTQPTFLLYAPVRGGLQLVGAAYSERISLDDSAPSGIGAARAEWHLHQACFGIPGIGFTLADGVEDCRGMGGIPGPRQTAMVHVWSALASPEGPFRHDNIALPFGALGLATPAGADAATRGLAVVLADSYGFRLPFVKRLDVVAAHSPLQEEIAAHRKAIARLVSHLRRAESGGDRARHDELAVEVRARGDGRCTAASHRRRNTAAGWTRNSPRRWASIIMVTSRAALFLASLAAWHAAGADSAFVQRRPAGGLRPARAEGGIRFGYDFTGRGPGLGVQAKVPFARALDLMPSADWVVRGSQSGWQWNIDGAIRIGRLQALYLGGGAGIANSVTRANVFAGIAPRAASTGAPGAWLRRGAVDPHAAGAFHVRPRDQFPLGLLRRAEQGWGAAPAGTAPR